MKLDLFSFLS
ncbi:hypothetical protein F383_16445 [Gossypium arboreum]|uniref:Uncharacterized protein n=1 Tax=Gossypium arboreum TaxID=29729 RepID=A0A0B0PVG9_GOSAR|nr:hypothetical protein F383_16445 [Gossypium arboreum]